MDYGSKPQKTESFDSIVAGWSGKDNPINKKQDELNPPAHGFHKAKKGPKFQAGYGSSAGAPGHMKGG